jgi:non-ribosomal peptide synthetase component E (peptide arylation enzyme)
VIGAGPGTTSTIGASRLASHLDRQGLQPGDSIAIDLFNTPEYLETFFAALKLDAPRSM